MEDEPIFGPFTFKQVVYGGGSFAVAYYCYQWLEPKFSIPIVIIMAGLIIRVLMTVKKVVIDEAYIQKKRFHCRDLAEFQRWVKRRIAFIQFEISGRAEQGMGASADLEKKLAMFQNALQNMK